MFRCAKTLIALAMVIAIPLTVSGQTADNPLTPSGPAQPASQPPPTAELLKPEQLEALVAPIALYPDELLANVLAASTYPLEIVQADRWLKALTSTAAVVSMMSDKVDWTKNLGDAVLAQQADVMDEFSAYVPKPMTAKNWSPPNSRQSAFGHRKTDRRS